MGGYIPVPRPVRGIMKACVVSKNNVDSTIFWYYIHKRLLYVVKNCSVVASEAQAAVTSFLFLFLLSPFLFSIASHLLGVLSSPYLLRQLPPFRTSDPGSDLRGRVSTSINLISAVCRCACPSIPRDPLCSGRQDVLTNSSNTCVTSGSCTDCSRSCTGSVSTFNGLFDLEDDPREERNVIDSYPEVIVVNPTRCTMYWLLIINSTPPPFFCKCEAE